MGKSRGRTTMVRMSYRDREIAQSQKKQRRHNRHDEFPVSGKPVPQEYIAKFQCALLVYLIGDVILGLFTSDIATLPAESLNAKARKAREGWSESYHHLNMNYFNRADDSQKMLTCDLMADFEEYTHNDVVRLKLAYLSGIRGIVPDELTVTVSTCLVCACLADLANNLHGQIYKTAFGHPANDLDLAKMCRYAAEFAEAIAPLPPGVTSVPENRKDAVSKAQYSLGLRMGEWFRIPDGIYMNTFFEKK